MCAQFLSEEYFGSLFVNFFLEEAHTNITFIIVRLSVNEAKSTGTKSGVVESIQNVLRVIRSYVVSGLRAVFAVNW